jgi:pteridine reductase
MPIYRDKGTALVTGAAKRIGQVIACFLAGYGYKIILHYNESRAEAEKTARMIIQSGGNCKLFRCNLENEEKTSALIDRISKEDKDLTLLVNNASLFQPSNFRTETNNLFNRHMNVNLKAPFILTRDFARICKRGHIINILDTNISKNKTNHLSYLLSKKALCELTKLSAVELAPYIRVNAIAPGLILPPKGKKGDYLDRLTYRVPLKTKGTLDQIAYSMAFLIENTYLTGQVIYNDGGENLI